LCNWLSERIFDARVVKEYAREYLQKKGNNYAYSQEDVLLIARKTSELLTKAFKSNCDALIVDTDFYVLDIWWRERYGESNEEISLMKETYDFDLYLVCQPDLPWEADPLRENEEDRDRLSQFEDNFNRAVLIKSAGIMQLVYQLRDSGIDRKAFALGQAQTVDSYIRPIVFKNFDCLLFSNNFIVLFNCCFLPLQQLLVSIVVS
jgi:nicotinamide riboside kinase